MDDFTIHDCKRRYFPHEKKYAAYKTKINGVSETKCGVRKKWPIVGLRELYIRVNLKKLVT